MERGEILAEEPRARTRRGHPSGAFDVLIEATLKSAKDDDRIELLFFDLSTEFQKEKSALKKCTRIKNLFELRKAALEEKLKNKPPFSWSMPEVKIPEHPSVQAFLRGEGEKMTYSVPFKTVQEVRNFINDLMIATDGVCICESSPPKSPKSLANLLHYFTIISAQLIDSHIRNLQLIRMSACKLEIIQVDVFSNFQTLVFLNLEREFV